ncbi:MAG: peptide chain release factor N(5)-glutamine methyltransferase [Treponema sp.]|nr:peptide chain release factor N(5)-glutamine methyltransferase [Treponema sp.]
MFVREAYAQGSADLKYAGIKTHELDASLLLAFVLKKDRTFIITANNEKISDKYCAVYCELIERRAGGECIAYLTGKKEFWGLEFLVNKAVLVPRPDTETLVETAIGLISHAETQAASAANIKSKGRREEIKVLDLCTGSGAIAVSLKHEKPELEVYATDICPNALKTAKENAERLLGKNKIQFFLGDLFYAFSSPSPASAPSVSPPNLPEGNLDLWSRCRFRFEVCENSSTQKFALIISNPPYIPSAEIETLSAEVQNEPRLALDGGACGLEIIKQIIDKVPNYLEQNGFLLLEADPRQMHEIQILLDKKGFKDIQLYNDLSGLQRVIGGRYEK